MSLTASRSPASMALKNRSASSRCSLITRTVSPSECLVASECFVLGPPARNTRMRSVLGEPGGDQVGHIVAGAGGLLEVVVPGQVLDALVGRRDGVEDLARLRREHAGVGVGLDDE